MGRHYRYRLPIWLRQLLLIIEQCLLPIVIFQAIRTIFLPTTFDVIILALIILLYTSFYFKWI